MATGLYSPVTITKHGTSGINIPNIKAQGFIPSGASSPGFQIADIFQEGPKVFTSTDPNLIAQYGDEFVEVITPEGNLRLPSGGINLGAGTFGFGTEVVSTPTQADKGMRLVEKLRSGVYPTSATARRLLETGTNVNPNLRRGIMNTGKFFGRFIPGLSTALGAANVIDRFNQGEYLRMLMAGGSMLPVVGIPFAAAEMATDAGEALINKEKEKEVIRQRAQNAAKAQESRNQSRDDYTGGGGTVVIGKGGGQTKTVSPRSREAMYSAPTRRSSPPPFRRFNNGGIVGLFRRF